MTPTGPTWAVVNVAVADAQGRTVPTAGNLIHFKVGGPGRDIGVGNGDPTCHEPDRADQRSAFNGLCQMILQSDGHPGAITRDGHGRRPGGRHGDGPTRPAPAASRPAVP